MKKKPLDFSDCIRVVASVHNLDTNRYSIELEFRKEDGQWSSVLLPRKIIRSGISVIDELLDRGAGLPTGSGAGSQLALCLTSSLRDHIG